MLISNSIKPKGNDTFFYLPCYRSSCCWSAGHIISVAYPVAMSVSGLHSCGHHSFHGSLPETHHRGCPTNPDVTACKRKVKFLWLSDEYQDLF